MVGARQVLSQCGDAGFAMRFAYYFLGIKAMDDGPSPPDPLYRRGGIDKHAVHIEQQGPALDFCHV
jgi:hypothetical protein